MKTIRNIALAALAGTVLVAGTAAIAQDAKPEAAQPKAEAKSGQRAEGKHGRHGGEGAGAGCAEGEHGAKGHRQGRMGHRHGGGHDHSQS